MPRRNQRHRRGQRADKTPPRSFTLPAPALTTPTRQVKTPDRYRPYILIDLDFGRGISLGITQRRFSHVLGQIAEDHDAGKGHPEKRKILADIYKSGSEPGILELPWPPGVDPKDWVNCLTWWDSFFKEAGYTLYNDPGKKALSLETRARIAAGKKAACERARAAREATPVQLAS
jgi:hypothetical protein